VIRLLVVSLIWALSFGLIKGRLAGLDPTAVAAVRLAAATALFLPFLRLGGLRAATLLRLTLVGTLQFGAMYLLYLRAYAYLAAYQVALFTIFTPLFVVLLDAAWERRWRNRYAVAAALSVLGAAAALGWSRPPGGVATGFVLVQLSNLCFALGQLAWRRERRRLPAAVSDASVFALPYAGALMLTLIVSLGTTRWGAFAPAPVQWATIAYLGLLASGAAFFWWNQGAAQVNAGTLAAVNNLKIPLGIAASLTLFGEHADLPNLLASGLLLGAAVWIAQREAAPSSPAEPDPA
jgi:drug/metabolite transporter (DMT)-like permease